MEQLEMIGKGSGIEEYKAVLLEMIAEYCNAYIALPLKVVLNVEESYIKQVKKRKGEETGKERREE